MSSAEFVGGSGKSFYVGHFEDPTVEELWGRVRGDPAAGVGGVSAALPTDESHYFEWTQRVLGENGEKASPAMKKVLKEQVRPSRCLPRSPTPRPRVSSPPPLHPR